MRRGIEDGELLLHYQPQIDLASGKILSVETMVRWQPPGRAMVPPDDFIGLAERTDLITLTSFVITQAIAQAAISASVWSAAPRVAVNLSPRNLNREDLVDFIAGELEAKGLPPQALEVEVTESAVMANPTQAADVMSRICSIGVKSP